MTIMCSLRMLASTSNSEHYMCIPIKNWLPPAMAMIKWESTGNSFIFLYVHFEYYHFKITPMTYLTPLLSVYSKPISVLWLRLQVLRIRFYFLHIFDDEFLFSVQNEPTFVCSTLHLSNWSTCTSMRGLWSGQTMSFQLNLWLYGWIRHELRTFELNSSKNTNEYYGFLSVAFLFSRLAFWPHFYIPALFCFHWSQIPWKRQFLVMMKHQRYRPSVSIVWMWTLKFACLHDSVVQNTNSSWFPSSKYVDCNLKFFLNSCISKKCVLFVLRSVRCFAQTHTHSPKRLFGDVPKWKYFYFHDMENKFTRI